MMVGFEIMRTKGLLLPDINPLIQLAVMYPVSQYGSTLPDLDHHWDSVGAKSPVNKIVHFFLHLTNPKHRSWQTHSILFTGGFLFLLHALVTAGIGLSDYVGLTAMDWTLLRLLLNGFELGVLSHLCLDLINPSGIHLYPGKKIRLVPKGVMFFATGNRWETIIFHLCNIISVFALLNLCLSFFDHSLFGLLTVVLAKFNIS